MIHFKLRAAEPRQGWLTGAPADLARALRAGLSAKGSRGLVEKRIPSTGHGERCQLVPERSLERNRRVEFLRLQEGESCPADCSK